MQRRLHPAKALYERIFLKFSASSSQALGSLSELASCGASGKDALAEAMGEGERIISS